MSTQLRRINTPGTASVRSVPVTPSRDSRSVASLRSINSAPAWVTPGTNLALPTRSYGPMPPTEPLVEAVTPENAYDSDASTISDYEMSLVAPPVQDYMAFVDWLNDNFSTYLDENFQLFLRKDFQIISMASLGQFLESLDS